MRLPRLAAALAVGLALAGCQQSATSRSAPTPGELLGASVAPLPGPVTLRYGPVSAAAFSATRTATASIGATHRSWEDSLTGVVGIVPAGGGLLRVRAQFDSPYARLSDELDVGPFEVVLMITDRGEIRDIDYAFEARPTRTQLTEVHETLGDLMPIFAWPVGAIVQDEPFEALTVGFGDDPAARQEVGLKIVGQTMRAGRLAYVVNYAGAVPFRGDVTAFSGYYLVDAGTGLVVEQVYAVRGKDYEGVHLLLYDLDVESHIVI